MKIGGENSSVGETSRLVFYRFHDKELFILRVVHGARDLESLF
jgi:plasmid stabilization system protein ParE